MKFSFLTALLLTTFLSFIESAELLRGERSLVVKGKGKGKGSDDSIASEPSKGKKTKSPGGKKSKAPGKKRSKAPKIPKACEETLDDDESSKGKGTKAPTDSKGKGKGTKAPSYTKGKGKGTKAPGKKTKAPKADKCETKAPSGFVANETDPPTPAPTSKPTPSPTAAPTSSPSPSAKPSASPFVTASPTKTPTKLPTFEPTRSINPSASPTDRPTAIFFDAYCDPLANSTANPTPCYVVPETNCPNIRNSAKCGSTDACDACPPDSLCQTDNNGDKYCVTCGCGFYDSNGIGCCRSNGNDKCVPNSNNGRNKDQCTPKYFGGIPSIDGGANSDICNGNEEIGGNSCLMAPVNSDCTCFPSATELCKTASEAKTVCRAKDMAEDALTNDCSACRTCMINECSSEAGGEGDWSTEVKVVETLEAWNDLTCRTVLATSCADVCAF